MTKAAELAKMGEVLTNSQIGRKNIIINGAMQISQRSTSETGKGDADGYFTLDRFRMGHGATSAGRYTMSQSSVTDLEGFSNALKIDCTTADTSIAAGEALIINQRLEGFNLQQIKATSTSTRAFTVSFYAKSNASRAIASEITFSNGTNRQISKLHTIGTSWARYTMTVPAASSTQIDNDNSHEGDLNFWMHAGSTYSSGTINDDALDSITNANRAVGIGSIFASTDNTLEITGIQLEVGSQATPFEHRSVGEEFTLCQRYYIDIANSVDATFGIGSLYTASVVYGSLNFPTQMRANPTLIMTTGTNYYLFYTNGSSDPFNSVTLSYSSPEAIEFYNQTEIGSVSGYSGFFRIGNSSAMLALDAEL